MSKELLLIIVLSVVLVVVTAAVVALFAIDLKRAKSGKKAFLWERKEPKRKVK